MSNGPILSIKNATVRRGDNTALKNISLEINKGEHHVVLGPNGSGKSTLLKLITRELNPLVQENSYIKLFGEQRVAIWELREKIGIVSHDFQMDYQGDISGLDVVTSAFFGSVGIHQHHIVTDEHRQLSYSMMVELGIEKLANQLFMNLSTGQQRRLIFARALAHRPSVLVLDEPTNSLDIQTRFWFIDAIRKLANDNTTIILVTHDPQEIIPEIQQVSLLKNGELFMHGQTQDILNSRNCSLLFDTDIDVINSAQYYQFLPKNSAYRS